MIQEKRDKPLTGQSGPPLKLTLDGLNKDERKVYSALWAASQELSLDELSRLAFKLKPNATKANSRVRNALRRLVRAGGVTNGSKRGLYATGTVLPSGAVDESANARQRQTKAPPDDRTTSSAAHEAAPTSRERLERRVAELRAQAPAELICDDEDTRKLALILVAAEELGPKDTAIAKLTGYSRGSVIRRLSTLKNALPKAPTPGFWEAKHFWTVLRHAVSAPA
jgi:hypothetical protein